MLFLRLWNYLRGYVIIVVEGYFLEKFINICIHRQIFLWEIKRSKDCTMTLKVSIKGFKLLRPIARKTNCRIRIKGKKGLPFVVNKYRRRKTFVLGAVVFVFLMYVLTSFVWSVEVKGNEKIETQLLLQKLEQFGVKPGVLKFSINPKSITTDMMLEVQELAWIGVEVKGTKVKVEVEERVKPPELISKNVPCDIVAAKDGVIKSVSAKAGQYKVKAGETVTKGQVLISGLVENKNDTTKIKKVHAIGTVLARTWYEKNCAVNTKPLEKERTGNYKDQYSLVLFTKRINLFHGKIKYTQHEKVEMRKRLCIGENLALPFELIIDRYYENSIYEKEISLDEAKQAASDAAYKEASEGIPEDAEIVKTDVNFLQKDDGELVANVIIECIENIGVTKEIGGE